MRRTLTVCLALLTLGLAQAALGADWDLWTDKTAMPPDDQTFGLPIVPTGQNIVVSASETDTSAFSIDVHQTLEKDGEQYMGLQVTRDMDLTATAPVGKYLFGLIGSFYPPDASVDVRTMVASWHMTELEVDGTVVPIDSTFLAYRPDFPFVGQDLAFYDVFVRFNTLGAHTLVQRFRPQPYYYVEDYEAAGLEDPHPEFERRRVSVPEAVGDPVDGVIELRYSLEIVEEVTAVRAGSWGMVKHASVAAP